MLYFYTESIYKHIEIMMDFRVCCADNNLLQIKLYNSFFKNFHRILILLFAIWQKVHNSRNDGFRVCHAYNNWWEKNHVVHFCKNFHRILIILFVFLHQSFSKYHLEMMDFMFVICV